MFASVFKLDLSRVFKLYSDKAREAAAESRRRNRYKGLDSLRSGNKGGGYSRAVAEGIFHAMHLRDAPRESTKSASHTADFRGSSKEECQAALYYAQAFLKASGFTRTSKKFPGKTADMGIVERWDHNNGAHALVDYTDFSRRQFNLGVEVFHNKGGAYKTDFSWIDGLARILKGESSAQDSGGPNPYVFTPKGVETRPEVLTGKPKKTPKGTLTEADMIALGTAPGQTFPTIRGTQQGGGTGIPTYAAPGNPVSMSAKFEQVLKGGKVRKYNPKGINQYTKTGTSVDGPRDRLVGATKHQQRLMTTYMTGFTKNLKNPAEKAYAEARVAQMVAGEPRPSGMSGKHGLEKRRAIQYEALIYKIFQAGRKKHNV